MSSLFKFILLPLLFLPVHRNDPKVVVFMGDSLTAGYGLDESQAYPAHIQKKLDDLELDYLVVNAGISGDTSAGGLRRTDWLLRGRVDILVLILGANDGLRGIDLESTMTNLQGIIDKTRQRYPQVKIVIGGMMVPPNLGQEYTEKFRNMYPDLAGRNQAVLIPFLLDDVAGETELNLSDGIHPNARGHEIISETVWKYLWPVIKAGE